MMTTGINSQNQSQLYSQKTRENDTIYYIGHGLLEKSPSSTSVMHVISHELDHVAEFKSQAIRDRAEIRSLDLKVDYEYRNGKLVAVGGETSITTALPIQEESKHTSRKAFPALREDLIDINTLKKVELPSDGLNMQESKLKEKLEQIETEIDFSLKKTYYSDPNFKTAADIKDAAREQELRETKSRISLQLEELRNKEIVEKSRSLMTKIKELQNNFRDSLVKLGLMQGTGRTLDTFA
jgi:chaperonin cofactor prefoldin